MSNNQPDSNIRKLSFGVKPITLVTLLANEVFSVGCQLLKESTYHSSDLNSSDLISIDLIDCSHGELGHFTAHNPVLIFHSILG